MMSVLILQAGSLMISEIMPDPDPALGLPPYEFVEWYNPGADTVDLAGWQWVVGDKVKRVAGGRVAPGGYVIVCSPAAAAAFRAFGSVIALDGFPALRNSGDRLSLVDPSGIAVHTVDYSPGQFTDALKANGGWSLELADPVQYCNPAAWLPSIDPSGGTPGRENSLRLTLPPAAPPRLIRAAGYDGHTFILVFSGNLNPALDVNNYACRLMPGSIDAFAVPAPEQGFRGLFFNLPAQLDTDSLYMAELTGAINDCSGQVALLRPVQVGFPTEPDSADVVISEVLFDPAAGQSEFVEVYNRSGKVIELKDLILARAGTDGTVISFSDQQDISYWLFPDSYAVFTADEGQFLTAWPLTDPAALAERADMPGLSNVESQLILMTGDQKLLDRVSYSPDWHYPYLDETKGVSLERIDFGSPGTLKSNWFSASPSSGGSTPGTKNSAGSVLRLPDSQHFALDPGVGYSAVSPNPVQVAVSYRFEEAGWFMRVNVLNSYGLPVAEIFAFGLAPVEGRVYWNGLDQAQQLAPDGIYLIVADYYHPSGVRGRWKSACAIVRNY